MPKSAKPSQAKEANTAAPSNSKPSVPAIPTTPRTLEEYRQHLQHYKERGIAYNVDEHGYDSDDEHDEHDPEEESSDEEHVPAPAPKGTKKTLAQVTQTAKPPTTSARPQSGITPLEVESAPSTAVQPASLASINKTKKMPRHLKTKHRKINREHPEFELTYDMMLGIRTTVSLVEAKPYHPLSAQDLKFEIKLRFPGYGSSITPAHEARDFKFKDYMPEVFRHIRARFDIDPAEYLMCVCGNFEFLEFVSNSKSGQFFFYSHDRRYMIKTVTQEESKFLRKILPAYYDHIMKNPNTLLTRFFGMHRVKPHKKREQHFLIMGSVFYTQRQIDLVYDLKGSTQGRQVTAEQRQSSSCVFKDLDFLQDNQRIAMGPTLKEELCAQLQRDVKFLQELDIMDYSLLVGVHDMRRHPERDDDDDEEESVAPTASSHHGPALSAGSMGVGSVGTDGRAVSVLPVLSEADELEDPPHVVVAAQSMRAPELLGGAVVARELDFSAMSVGSLGRAVSTPLEITSDYIDPLPPLADTVAPAAAVAGPAVDLGDTASEDGGDVFVDEANTSVQLADETPPSTRADEDAAQRRDRKSLFLPPKYNKCATPQQHHVSFKPAPTTQELLRVSTVTAASSGASSAAAPSSRARGHPTGCVEEYASRPASHSFSGTHEQPHKPPTPRRIQSAHSHFSAHSHAQVPTAEDAQKEDAQVHAPLVAVAGAPVVEEVPPAKPLPQSKPGLDFLPAYSVFMQDDGGIRGRDANGEATDLVYYMGIIDILTVYNWRKRGETFLKTFKYKKEEISAVHPKPYARRFVKFLGEAID